MLLALLNGACLVIVNYKIYINPYLLYESLFDVVGITFLQVVPSVFMRWDHSYQKQILMNKRLRIIAFGGENFPIKILENPRHKYLRLFNLYGITEISCWASVYEVQNEDINEVPLGIVLDDTMVMLKDHSGNPVVNGCGEIFIGKLVF